MPNPLFSMLGGGMPSMPGPLGDFTNMIQQFNQFRANFQGDPKAEVERLLQSGQMTQDQLNQLQGMAWQIMQFIPR